MVPTMVLEYQKIIVFLLTLFSLFTAGHVVLNKRDPRAGFGWVVTSLMFIGIGPLLYWVFGTNRIRTHAKKLYRQGLWTHQTETGIENWGPKLPENGSFDPGRYSGILKVSERVNRHPLMAGNKIQILQNGEEAYPAMLEAVSRAEKFIYLSTYIFDSGPTGRAFVKALAEAQSRGVQVWVMVDAFGEHYSHPRISGLLKGAGIKTARFLPVTFSMNTLHFNLRNHRKILVVDGKTGFTGGMNIRDRHWAARPGNKAPVLDTHFKIQGPVVLEFQELFLEDWFFATRESLPWLAEGTPPMAGESVCRAISGGPNEDFEKISWILLGALTWAKKRIQIMTPYFVPDRVMIYALNTAALRGVEVEILLPEKNNLPFVGWASRAILWEMLQNGVKFYYRPPPFAHSKLFIADEDYALIGSSNWDARSFRLNFELDLEVYDSTVAKSLSAHFDGVKLISREVTLDDVNKDPLAVRLRNSFSKLFSPYL
ncbi:MAG TPA: cardiolipin synthase [bacterium]|nr:cardiolipin synthase [bacterium]